MPNLQASFFVPDRLPYNRASLGDATLTVSVVLQASGETGAIVDAAATFTDDCRASRPGFRCTLTAT